ncbi:hypothetical protein HK096_007164 [Nowakowskiella sp. JEL0078]|nr:hypothetical protein HK096_007164 [Nowakowskiella sp. JEL0078]
MEVTKTTTVIRKANPIFILTNSLRQPENQGRYLDPRSRKILDPSARFYWAH